MAGSSGDGLRHLCDWLSGQSDLQAVHHDVAAQLHRGRRPQLLWPSKTTMTSIYPLKDDKHEVRIFLLINGWSRSSAAATSWSRNPRTLASHLNPGRSHPMNVMPRRVLSEINYKNRQVSGRRMVTVHGGGVVRGCTAAPLRLAERPVRSAGGASGRHRSAS